MSSFLQSELWLIADQSQVGYSTAELVTEYFGTERLIKITSRVVLIESHWAVGKLCRAVRPIRSLSSRVLKPGFIMWFYFRGRIGSWIGTTLVSMQILAWFQKRCSNIKMSLDTLVWSLRSADVMRRHETKWWCSGSELEIPVATIRCISCSRDVNRIV